MARRKAKFGEDRVERVFLIGGGGNNSERPTLPDLLAISRGECTGRTTIGGCTGRVPIIAPRA
jgi:hypothetical protein